MDNDSLIQRLPVFQRKLDHARSIIAAALSQAAKPYLSWSTGKDSTAMLALVAEQCPGIRIMRYDSGYELPENDEYAKYVLILLGIPQEQVDIVRPPCDPFEAKIEAGYFDLAAIAKVNERVMIKPIREWATKGEYDLAFIGLRKEESAARRMMTKTLGQIHYCKKNKIMQCYPMANFTAGEVFGLLDYYGIKPHPVYEKTKFQPREWVRVNWLIVSAGAEKGTLAWLRYYYPDIFARLADRLPEMKGYI